MLTKNEFHQKLARFAQQQPAWEYDCSGQKIVCVNIETFIHQLPETDTTAASSDLNSNATRNSSTSDISALKKRWGISEIATEVLCYVPADPNLHTGNILPLQLEFHHHFSLITRALKQQLMHPTKEPTTVPSNFFRNFTSASPVNSAPVSFNAADIDRTYQLMMFEINLAIFQQLNFLSFEAELKKMMETYQQYLSQPTAESAFTEFYKTIQAFNAHCSSLMKAYLDDNEVNHNNNASSHHATKSSHNKKIHEINRTLDNLRPTLAKQYYIYYFHALKKQGIILTQSHVRAIEKLLPKTPADLQDKLVMNSSTGNISYVTASKYTSHDKKFDDIAIRQIAVSYMPDGMLLYRIESLAATDEEKAKQNNHHIEGNNSESFYQDVAKKLKTIQNKINNDLLEQIGEKLTQSNVIHYNLLTSYGTTLEIKGIFGDDEAKNHQNWSTEIIIEGIHRRNFLNLTENSPLFLLCNLGVNGFGIGTTTGKQASLHGNSRGIEFYLKFEGGLNRPSTSLQSITNEVFCLAEMSILKLLADKMPNNNLSSNADEALRHYKGYLLNRKSIFFSQSPQYSTFKENIDKAKNNLKDTFPLLSKNKILQYSQSKTGFKEKQQLITLALAKIFSENEHLHAKNGMLVQSLLIALQDITIAGCKSANERFANVQGLAEAAYHPEFQAALESFVVVHDKNDDDDFVVISNTTSVDQLYDTLSIIFNNNSLYQNAGQVVSFSDQGSGPKTENIDNSALIPNTNRILNPLVTSLAQSRAEALQAKKLESHGILCQAFGDYQKEEEILTQIFKHLSGYIETLTLRFSGNIISDSIEEKIIKFNTSLQILPTQHDLLIYTQLIKFVADINANVKNLGDTYGTSRFSNIYSPAQHLIQFYEERYPHFKVLSPEQTAHSKSKMQN